jgi:hypothetical protein
MDDNEQTSGLDVLRSSLGSAMESGGPLASVIRRSMEKAGVPEEISVDYEPYRAPEREMPARQTQYRDELMRQLQSTTEKLLTPKPEPKNLLEALSRRFVMPTGKSGDLLIARQERAAKEEEEDLKRREAILSILDKQARLEREQEEDLARARAAEAEARAKGAKPSAEYSPSEGRQYVFKDGAAAGVAEGRAPQVFKKDLGYGYIDDEGDFRPAREAPAGTRVVTSGALNPVALSKFDDRQLKFTEELIGLEKMQDYFKNVTSLDRGFKNLANRFIADIKNFIGKPIEGKQFSTLEASAQQQALLGAIRLEVLGGGVLTEIDAQRLINTLGGDMASGRMNPDLVAARLKSLYKEKHQRADLQSRMLKRDANYFGYDPEEFSLTVPATLGGDVLRSKPPAEKPKEKPAAPRPPAAGANLPMTKRVGNETWTLKVDAKGNRAYVSPDGKKFEEVR